MLAELVEQQQSMRTERTTEVGAAVTVTVSATAVRLRLSFVFVITIVLRQF